MTKINKVTLAILMASTLPACQMDKSLPPSLVTSPVISPVISPVSQGTPSPAPVEMEIQSNYLAKTRFLYIKDDTAVWDHMVETNDGNITSFNEKGEQATIDAESDTYPAWDTIEAYIEGQIYPDVDLFVKFEMVNDTASSFSLLRTNRTLENENTDGNENPGEDPDLENGKPNPDVVAKVFGVFKTRWYANEGEMPGFISSNGPWKQVATTDENGKYLPKSKSIMPYSEKGTYPQGEQVRHIIDGTEHFFEAKWWVSPAPVIDDGLDGAGDGDGNTGGDGEANPAAFNDEIALFSQCSNGGSNNPIPILTGTSAGMDPEWCSPWKVITIDPEKDPIEKPDFGGDLLEPPVGNGSGCVTPENLEGRDCAVTLPEGTPTVPPVVEVPLPEITEKPTPLPLPQLDENGLPAEGYAFLRALTMENWDWFFPLRQGKTTATAPDEETPPKIRVANSVDNLTLETFKKAVIQYNAWALANEFAQFVNEGSQNEQATEFAAFWAQGSKFTSGTTLNSVEPWIVIDPIIEQTVWKGGLNRLEQKGWGPNSVLLGSVDPGSKFKPVPKQSYHGRGVFHMSWNSNYGAFSQWLYRSGILQEVILTDDELLKNPNLVLDNAELAMLSGIWIWMTPKGAKPAAHAVIYGNVTNVSQSTRDPGLPPRNDAGVVPVSKGETHAPEVMAYRLGTITNIMNGGLECNKAGTWNASPLQRVSYYNAFGQYLNKLHPSLNITLVPSASDVWTTRVTMSSKENLKTASCFAQKSYYTWK